MKKVLFIGLVFPESTSTAAGSRMLQLTSFFKAQNYEITFASAAQENKHSDDLDKLAITKVAIELNAASFDEFIKELNPNIVMFDRFISEEQFGWRVSEHCPNALKILDTEDLHGLRAARHKAFKKGEIFELETMFDQEITKREIASIYRCDLSLIISSFEMELLTKQFKIPTTILQELPFMLGKISQDEVLKKPSFDKRIDFISIGNFKHEPNWQSVLHLKKSIWPLIKKQLPNARLLIYGAYATQKVNDLHNEIDGFIIKGRAENAHDVIANAKILLAPLQFGAGLKGKLIEAMQNGTPSVTTTIGAEGMHSDLPWNGFTEDDYQEFATKAVELYTNKEVWLQAQQNGYQLVNTIYDKNSLSEKLKIKIEGIQDDLAPHRTQNFIGAMLQHHSLQSTKYLSKWLAEKNKR